MYEEMVAQKDEIFLLRASWLVMVDLRFEIQDSFPESKLLNITLSHLLIDY